MTSVAKLSAAVISLEYIVTYDKVHSIYAAGATARWQCILLSLYNDVGTCNSTIITL